MSAVPNQNWPSTQRSRDFAQVAQRQCQLGTLKRLQATEDLAEPLGTYGESSTGLGILFWLFQFF